VPACGTLFLVSAAYIKPLVLPRWLGHTGLRYSTALRRRSNVIRHWSVSDWSVYLTESGICYDEARQCRDVTRHERCTKNSMYQYANVCKRSCGLCGKDAYYFGRQHVSTVFTRWRVRASQGSACKSVVLNLGSRDPLGVPNANLGGPKRKSGISTNFPQYVIL